MRRPTTVAAAVLLIAAACGGGSTAETSTTTAGASTTAPTTAPTTTTTTVPPSTVITSDDGRVAIEVPDAALPGGDPGITITAVAPGDAFADVDTPVFSYALEPDGLEFSAPVTVTMTIPFDELAADGFETSLPLATLVTTSDDGWTFLGDLRLGRDEANLIVSGSIDHFSGLAAIQEQIFLQTRFLELTQDRTERLGLDFLWSNGVLLVPPDLLGSAFTPLDGQATESTGVDVEDGVLTLTCPPEVTTAIGDLDLTFLLRSVSDSAGETGIVAAPKVSTLHDDQAEVTISAGLQLLCRPTITADGSLTIDIAVDHPDGEVIVPDGDFKNGLSALYLYLGPGLLPMYVGLIRDVDGDGQVGPNDIMYPPEATDITDGISTATLPLFGYGDYFPYFIAERPSALTTEVLVRDGASILLGGLSVEETAVPYLDGVPFLTRVFSDESRQSETTELVILVTPRIIQEDE